MKSGIAVLGILSILLVVVSVSGCIGNGKTLYQYNLTSRCSYLYRSSKCNNT